MWLDCLIRSIGTIWLICTTAGIRALLLQLGCISLVQARVLARSRVEIVESIAEGAAVRLANRMRSYKKHLQGIS